MGPPVDEFSFWDGERDVKLQGSSGDTREEALQALYVGPVRRRCHCEGEVIHVRDHDACWDVEVEGGDINKKEEGGQRGALGGSY